MTEVENSEDKMEQLRAQAKEAFDDLKHRAHGTYEKASQTYSDTVNRVRGTSLADVKTTIVDYVKEHPVKVGAALVGFGALIGGVLAVRRRK